MQTAQSIQRLYSLALNLLPSTITAMALMSVTPGYAQDDFGYDFDEPEADTATSAFVSDAIEKTQIRIGITQVNNDNQHAARYSALHEEGSYLNLDIQHFNWQRDQQLYYALNASDLGTDNRTIDVSAGDFDFSKVIINYSEMTSFYSNSGQTPFRGTGKNSWRLLDDWQAASRSDAMDISVSDLYKYDQEINREKLKLSSTLRLDKHWGLSLALQSEGKNGKQVKGGAHFFNASSAYAVLLPNKIDQRTDQADVSVNYTKQDLYVTAQYSVSRFDNRINALTWQNPYSGVVFEAADFPSGMGQIAADPDNQFQQLRLQGLYLFSPKLKLKWDLARGLMEQDENLLPYTINTALPSPVGLPVSDINAEVDTSHANIAMFAQLGRKYRLDVRFLHDERDNRISRSLFTYVRGDSVGQIPEDQSIYNTPTSNKKQMWTINASSRLLKRARLTLGYDFITQDRYNTSVEKSEEDRLRAQLRWPIQTATIVNIKYQFSDRKSDTYIYNQSLLSRYTTERINAMPDSLRYINHPLMRQYHLASREQDQFSANVNHLFNSSWSIDLQASFQKNTYPETALGLTEQQQYEWVLTGAFQGTEQLSAYAFVAFNDFENEQASREYRGDTDGIWPDTTYPLSEASDPSRDWFATLGDSSVSVGVGGEWTAISQKVSVNIDYLYVDTKSDSDLKSASTALSLLPLPQNDSRLHELTSRLVYHYSSKCDLVLDYRYYRFRENDWAYDQVDVDTIYNLLSNNQHTINESINIIGLSIDYQFE